MGFATIKLLIIIRQKFIIDQDLCLRILFGRFKLIWKKYNDPQLDKAAGKVRRYFWIILAILIFNFLFQLFFFVL